MRRAIIRIIAIVVILAGAAYGYLVLTSPKPGDVPPVPAQSSSAEPAVRVAADMA